MKWTWILSIVLSLLPSAVHAEIYYQTFEVAGESYLAPISKPSLQFLYQTGNAPEYVHQDFGDITSVVKVSSIFWKPKVAQADEVSPQDTYRMFAQAMANEYDINSKRFIRTLECESGFQNIQSRVPKKGGPNGREDSWGVAQIHLPSHKDVTRSEALTPRWAIRWAADKFQETPEMWTCYRELF